jgi:uncharacterized protein
MNTPLLLSSTVLASLLGLCPAIGVPQVLAAEYDPVTADPVSIDTQYPPAMAELVVPSHGVKLNGILYQAQGAGPHKTVVLLHGYPGNERSLDLAQVIRRAGFNMLFFNYRGSWGSGGRFTWTNAVQDASSAVQFLRSTETRQRYHVDPERIILVGHSVGGWVAFMAAAADPKITCAAYIAGYNLGRAGQLMRQDEKLRAGLTAYVRDTTDQESGPIRAAASAQALIDEVTDNPRPFDLAQRADALRGRPLLLVAGAKDGVAQVSEHYEPVLKALKDAGADPVQSVVLDADHAFSAHRIALAKVLVQWLRTDCGRWGSRQSA